MGITSVGNKASPRSRRARDEEQVRPGERVSASSRARSPGDVRQGPALPVIHCASCVREFSRLSANAAGVELGQLFAEYMLPVGCPLAPVPDIGNMPRAMF